MHRTNNDSELSPDSTIPVLLYSALPDVNSPVKRSNLAGALAWSPREGSGDHDLAGIVTLPWRVRTLFDLLALADPRGNNGKVRYAAYIINYLVEETIMPTLPRLKDSADVAMVSVFHISWGILYDAINASQGAVDAASVRMHSQRMEEHVDAVCCIVMAVKTKRGGSARRTRRFLARYVELLGVSVVIAIITVVILAVLAATAPFMEIISIAVAVASFVALLLQGCHGLAMAEVNERHGKDHDIAIALADLLNETHSARAPVGADTPTATRDATTLFHVMSSEHFHTPEISTSPSRRPELRPIGPITIEGVTSNSVSFKEDDLSSEASKGLAAKQPNSGPASQINSVHGSLVSKDSHSPHHSLSGDGVAFRVNSDFCNVGSIVLPLGDFNNTMVQCGADALHARCILILLSDTFEIRIWNEAAVQATGFTEFDALGKNFRSLLASDASHLAFETMVNNVSQTPHPPPGQNDDDDLISVNEDDDKDVLLFHAQLGVMTVRITIRTAMTTAGVRQGLFIIGSYTNLQEGNVNRLQRWVHVMMQHHYKALQAAMGDFDPDTNPAASIAQQSLSRFMVLAQPEVLHASSEAMMYHDTVHISAFLGELTSDEAVRKMVEDQSIMVSSDIDLLLPEFVRLDEDRMASILIDLILFVAHGCSDKKIVTIKVARADSPVGTGMHMIDFIVSRPGKGLTPSTMSLVRELKVISVGTAPGLGDSDSLGTKSYIQNLGKIHNIVRTMMGLLTCTSSENELTMRVSVPMVCPEFRSTPLRRGGMSDAEYEDTSPHAKLILTILILETSTIDRFGLSQFAWDNGHAVLLASDIEDADAVVRRSAPHVLFIDSRMLNARKFAIAMSKDSPDTVLVWTTEYDAPPPSCYTLKKPIKSNDFHALMAMVAERMSSISSSKEQIAHVREIFSEQAKCPWQRGELLGQGQFGKVYSATNSLTGGKMAVKIVPLDLTDPGAGQKTLDLLQEIDVMRTLEHEHILHYFYCERGSDSINIFMEHADGGSLSGVMERTGALDLQTAASYTSHLLKAVSYIHKKMVIHRDIKGGNLLLSRGALKLGDFGSAKKLVEATITPENVVGTIRWMAPEVMNGYPYDWRCDIWSLGCTVIEMVTGKAPFPNVTGNSMQVMSYIMALEGVSDGGVALTGTAGSFVSMCLQVDPLKRPNADTLLTHPFVTDTAEEQTRLAAFQCKEPLRRKSMHTRRQSRQAMGARKQSVYSNSSEQHNDLERKASGDSRGSHSPGGGNVQVVASLPQRRKSRRISAWSDDEDNMLPCAKSDTAVRFEDPPLQTPPVHSVTPPLNHLLTPAGVVAVDVEPIGPTSLPKYPLRRKSSVWSYVERDPPFTPTHPPPHLRNHDDDEFK